MAQLLYERDSSDKHLKAVRRHLRLCTKNAGTKKLTDNITPFYNTLIEKQEATKVAEEARENAHDDVTFEDSALDDCIRNVFDHCEIYERNNLAERALVKVFPDKKYGDIVRMPVQDEPNAAEQIAVRIENLGESHDLFKYASVLRDCIKKVRDAINGYKESIKEQKIAEAEEEIAKADLRMQYENNYLDARKEFGKVLAERLFPSLSSRRHKITVEEEGTEEGTEQ